jgi:hypothetical protein
MFMNNPIQTRHVGSCIEVQKVGIKYNSKMYLTVSPIRIWQFCSELVWIVSSDYGIYYNEVCCVVCALFFEEIVIRAASIFNAYIYRGGILVYQLNEIIHICCSYTVCFILLWVLIRCNSLNMLYCCVNHVVIKT